MNFDIATSRSILGDGHARILEAKARLDADADLFSPPKGHGTTYFGCALDEMRATVYTEQWRKRAARNARKNQKQIRASTIIATVGMLCAMIHKD